MTRENSQMFKGTGTAIVTPFHREGNIDFKSFEKLIEYQIQEGIDYLVFLGTTGESATLNRDERSAIMNFALETVGGRVPVVMGLGGNNTQSLMCQIKEVDFSGIAAILSVSPYYNKPQSKGIFLHYKNIASVSPVPVIMYNVPGRTGSNIDIETTLRIADEIPGVIGIKEASGNLVQCAKIIKDKPSDFLVISGDDALTFPLMAIGGDGVISVIANAYPSYFTKMVKYCLKKDFDKAKDIHYKLLDMMQTLFVDGSPSGVKALLEIKGLVKNNLRLPMVKVNKGVYNQIATLAESI